jgi:chromosome segregation ATPase
MANNKFYGYNPKKEETVPNKGVPGSGNRLDRVNPYEFRKGMDYELTSIGVSRLAESTPEERETATEKVLKNLDEHQSYYSALIQFEGGMDLAKPIQETSFKKYLENYSSERGDGLVEVTEEIKDDKMTEPKYDKKEYTVPFKTSQLKEAIKKEIKNILKEDEDKEPSKKDVKKAGMSLSKTKDTLVKLKDKKQSLMDKRKKMFGDYKDKIQGLDPDKAKKEFDKYAKKQEPISKEIKDIEKEMKSLENTLEEAKHDEKELRREAARTMMGKDIHMEILNIIKEQGISLREGADGVRVYYEIAKLAYMEGLTAGMRNNI